MARGPLVETNGLSCRKSVKPTGMRQHLELRTIAGVAFTIVKPDIGDELLAQMREMVAEILDDDKDSAN